jgi:hypothetical protein
MLWLRTTDCAGDVFSLIALRPDQETGAQLLVLAPCTIDKDGQLSDHPRPSNCISKAWNFSADCLYKFSNSLSMIFLRADDNSLSVAAFTLLANHH